MANDRGATAHDRGPQGERYAARTHPEYVVLEIGAGLGALIVHAGGEMHGKEVEISPAGADEDRQHKEVLERSVAGQTAFTAVFDKLAAGRYTLWVDGIPRQRDVAVRDGEIAELDWTEARWVA
jgi:hypothetical protein